MLLLYRVIIVFLGLFFYNAVYSASLERKSITILTDPEMQLFMPSVVIKYAEKSDKIDFNIKYVYSKSDCVDVRNVNTVIITGNNECMNLINNSFSVYDNMWKSFAYARMAIVFHPEYTVADLGNEYYSYNTLLGYIVDHASLVVSEQSTVSGKIERNFLKSIGVNDFIEVKDEEHVINLVNRGKGFGLIMRNVVSPHKELHYLNIPLTLYEPHIYYIYNRYDNIPEYVKDFRNYMYSNTVEKILSSYGMVFFQ